jgi:hypothetical protein
VFLNENGKYNFCHLTDLDAFKLGESAAALVQITDRANLSGQGLGISPLKRSSL